MRDRGVLAFIVVSLFIGVVIGVGINYVLYKPQINEIQLRLADANSRLERVNEKLNAISTPSQTETTVMDVYSAVSPAVVFITSTVLTYDFQLQQEIPEEGVGSGVVVSRDGY